MWCVSAYVLHCPIHGPTGLTYNTHSNTTISDQEACRDARAIYIYYMFGLLHDHIYTFQSVMGLFV